MAQRLKRWESPRKEGRNDKGRGGSARKRQRQKQLKNLAKKLREQPDIGGDTTPGNTQKSNPKREGREPISSLFYFDLVDLELGATRNSLTPHAALRSLSYARRSTALVSRSIASVNLS